MNKRNLKSYAISYLESWLTLNPTIGCPIGCKYCNLGIMGWNKIETIKIAEPHEIITQMTLNKRFIPNKTILCVGARTEPMLKENLKITLSLLQEIDKLQHNNVVCLLTKYEIPHQFLEEISSLHTIKLIFCLTYSGLQREIEPVDNSKLRDNFKLVAKARYPIIHFWRPIIPKYNSSTKDMIQILEFVSKYASASVCSGLKLSPDIAQQIQTNLNISIPEKFYHQAGEFFPKKLQDKLLSATKKHAPHYPLFLSNTSCAISYLEGVPDYLTNWLIDERCKFSRCPIEQRNRCYQSFRLPTPDLIRDALNKLDIQVDYQIHEDYVFFDGCIQQEDLLFIWHQIGFPVRAKKIYYTSIWQEYRKSLPSHLVNQINKNMYGENPRE